MRRRPHILLAGLLAGATLVASGTAAQAQPAAHADAPSAAVRVPTGWSPLGDPLPGAVYALRRANGQLFAGGAFGTGLARWSESNGSWTILGSGDPRVINALAVGPDGKLYAGGSKPNGEGGDGFVARWTGSAWVDLGVTSVDGPPPHSDAVNAIAFDSQGRLYAGGMFTVMGGAKVQYLAVYDGSSWSAPPGSVQVITPVTSLAAGKDGQMFVGAFAVVGNTFGYAWSLQRGGWSVLPGLEYDCPGLNPCIGALAMAVDGAGTLHAAGQLKVGSALGGYARWDGRSWSLPAVPGTDGGSAVAVDESGGVYAAIGNRGDSDRWMVARMGDSATALGAPTGGIGVWGLTVNDGVAYAGFSVGGAGSPKDPWQVAAFTLPAKAKASALPRNVHFAGLHGGRPVLAWKAPAYLQPKTYRVEYRLTSGEPWRRVDVAPGTRRVTLPAAVAGHDVQVRIRARGCDWLTVTRSAPTA